MSQTLVQHLPSAVPAIVMFVVGLLYLACRATYLIYKRDLFYAGFDEGTYSSVCRSARMSYDSNSGVVAYLVSEQEYKEAAAGAYQRYVQGDHKQ